jgi:hypothetical protein
MALRRNLLDIRTIYMEAAVETLSAAARCWRVFRLRIDVILQQRDNGRARDTNTSGERPLDLRDFSHGECPVTVKLP